MSIKAQLYRWTDSETWRGNVVLVVLFALTLFSWLGCDHDGTGLQLPGRVPTMVPDAVDSQSAPVLAPDAAPDATPPPPPPPPPPPDTAPDIAACDDARPCPVCQACRKGACVPADEHERCGPQSCAGSEDSLGLVYTLVTRLCHGGACLPVENDCRALSTCQQGPNGSQILNLAACTRGVRGGVAVYECNQGRGSVFCSGRETCGRSGDGGGGIVECR